MLGMNFPLIYYNCVKEGLFSHFCENTKLFDFEGERIKMGGKNISKCKHTLLS